MNIEGTHLNIIKSICDKPPNSIILSGERLKAFPQISRTRQGCPLLTLLFYLLKVLARIIGEENKIKDIQISKEEKLNCPVAGDMILYLEKYQRVPKTVRPNK